MLYNLLSISAQKKSAAGRREEKTFHQKKRKNRRRSRKNETNWKAEKNTNGSGRESLTKNLLLYSGSTFDFFLFILFCRNRVEKQIDIDSWFRSLESEGVNPLAPRWIGCARVFALLNFCIFCYGGGVSGIFLFLTGFSGNEFSRGAWLEVAPTSFMG